MGQQVGKKVLALDLSTKSTGWAIGDEKGKLLGYGCLVETIKDPIVRIRRLRDRILEILKSNGITHVVCEEVQLDNLSNHTSKVLLYLQFAIIDAIYNYDANIQYEFQVPSHWRKLCGIKTGRGVKRAELKKADIEYVLNKYGIAANDDICDAIGILDSYYIDFEPNDCAW